MAERARDDRGRYLPKHGGKHDKLYRVWCGMKERCNNPHNKKYERYGGRGITVCDEWSNDFGAFRDWAYSHGYADGLTIDRINNNANYTPDNCRWVTRAEQNRNYSRNRMITYMGKTQCVSDWSKETGIKSATITWRIKNGKTLSEVFSTVDGRRKKYGT